MSVFHPAVYHCLYDALSNHEKNKALAEAVADLYDTGVQVAYHDAAIASLIELLAVLNAGEADAAIDDRLIAEDDSRAATIASARQLLDLLEANPALPFNGLDITYFANGVDDAAEHAVVDQAAAILGTPVADNTHRGGHYRVAHEIGKTSYEVVSIGSESRQRYERALVAVAEAEKREKEQAADSSRLDEDQPATPARGHGQDSDFKRHAMTADGDLTPRCGADGDVAVMASDVTCDPCLALLIEQDVTGYSAEQLAGTACMVCGRDFTDNEFRDEIGSRQGSPVYAHYDCDAPTFDPTQPAPPTGEPS